MTDNIKPPRGQQRGDVFVASDGTVKLVLDDEIALYIQPDGSLPTRGEPYPREPGRSWTFLEGGTVRDRLVAAIARAQDPALRWPA